MDVERAIEVLEWWVRQARATAVSDGQVSPNSIGFANLQAREDQTRRVLARVLGMDSLPDILSPSLYDDLYFVDGGIRQAEYALGKLRTDAETTRILGSQAPSMSADALHPLIWDAASKRWESGHYTDAVQRAATALSGYVKDRTGRYELGDKELMSQAFSLAAPQASKPRLRWPGNDDDLTVVAMRQGILNMAIGAFSAIRNPASHTIEDLPKQEALEQLAALSILARWIEACELIAA